jgi:hypothetical protein
MMDEMLVEPKIVLSGLSTLIEIVWIRNVRRVREMPSKISRTIVCSAGFCDQVFLEDAGLQSSAICIGTEHQVPLPALYMIRRYKPSKIGGSFVDALILAIAIVLQ